MTSSARKTVLRSIRFSQAEAEILQHDAEAKGVSFNALVSSIVSRYVEWDRLADRYGFIALPRRSFRFLISLLTTDQLATFGKETGFQNAPAITLFWFKRLDTETFSKFLAVSAKYCQIWDYQLTREGPRFVLTVHNDVDPAYSAAHRQYFDQAIRTIVGTIPKIEDRGTAVVFTFSDPGSRPPG